MQGVMNSVVMLVNPNRMRPPIAPLALDYLADALTQRGYAPVLCDLCTAEDWRQTLDTALEAVRPDAIAFTLRNLDDAYFASQDFILETSAAIVRHAMARHPVPLILGGVGFSIAPCETLRYTGARLGIWGDGEQALPELLDCLRAGGDLSRVAGAVYWADGAVRANAPALFDPADAPPRARRFAPQAQYFAEGGQAGIETKRGCGNACVYCVEPHAKGRHTRMMPPKRVADEMAALLDQGVNVFHLCDSEFNLPPEHARAVCEAIVRRGLHDAIRWYVYASPAPFDKELARAMRRAGCAGINFGADHADAAMLRRLGRSYGTDAIRSAVNACREAGIAVMADMLLGSPGETHESMARAVGFLQDLNPDCVGLSCGVRVYPHTPLAAAVKRQGALERNPHMHGCVSGNDDLLRPIFYVDAAIGGNILHAVSALTQGDPRFFHADPNQAEGNYNYNDNSQLSQAIREGARGAYWDILRRLAT